MIVDSQVHLWKAETPDWRWVPGRVAQLPEPFTIEKLVPLMDEAGVDRAVVVPPSWPGDRNDYGLEAAKRYPGRFAVMGRIPLEKPESAALLPKWRQQAGMLGVRLTLHRAQSALIESGTADWFWPAAEKARLPVMFLAPGNAPRFAPIAERHPQLPLIIDHMNLTAEIAKAGTIKRAIDEVTVGVGAGTLTLREGMDFARYLEKMAQVLKLSQQAEATDAQPREIKFRWMTEEEAAADAREPAIEKNNETMETIKEQ